MENGINFYLRRYKQNIKATTPAYHAYQQYASEEGFVQRENKQNCTTYVDHLCLIRSFTENDILPLKKVLWGNNRKPYAKENQICNKPLYEPSKIQA